MKAIRVNAFGGIEAMKLEDNVPIPIPSDHEVLVHVNAAGVGPWDAWVRSGKSVLPQPLPLTPGSDFSGVVEAVGSKVEHFIQGDHVFGVTNSRFVGAYAQYAVVEPGMIAKKPASMSDEEAASFPVIAVTAQQMLFDHGHVKSGDHVLVLGGAGNVGAYAVQLAHLAGAHVVATAKSHQINFVRSLGANEVMDADSIRTDTPTRKFSVILDLIGGDILTSSIGWIAPNGTIVSAVSQIDKDLLAKYEAKGGFMLVAVNTNDLEKLGKLVEEKKLKTQVGEVLQLGEASLAHEMMEGKPHKSGKIVLIPPK